MSDKQDNELLVQTSRRQGKSLGIRPTAILFMARDLVDVIKGTDEKDDLVTVLEDRLRPRAGQLDLALKGILFEDAEVGAKLLKHCRDFIVDHDIYSGETIYQSDQVIEDAYSFIEGICNIAGYAKMEEDDTGL